MDNLISRLLKYYLRQNYPVSIIMKGSDFKGFVPDLPGCEVCGPDLSSVFGRLEILRHRWIREHLLAGCAIPMPNTYLELGPAPPKSIEQISDSKEHGF